MPKLLNDQHEKFVQEIVKGASQKDAYVAAGFNSATDDAIYSNASRLIRNDKVRSRLYELQGKAEKQAVLTAAHFAERLERLASAAMNAALSEEDDTGLETVASKEAADVARQCSMDAAKLLGLVVDKSKVESENVNFVVSDSALSEEEWENEYGDEDAMATTEGATGSVN